ncbi:Fmp41p [Sugiyamaella lignohabitans]|uniref:Fmp41p n=1 Tax=Sugiyamaella lignohabitans TaxID=796027 RepID=A0A167CVA7_9ASCO|nr:Fmp41p [Sugiyamaella lignohabitans]ANB12145.1 Fmp41p [Sugiyamaella lignohabitans]
MSTAYIQRARKILCIGRNYVDHIKELGNSAPSQPFFFLKPTSSVLLPGQGPILRPKGTKLHYELELAVVLNKTLKNINPETFGEKEAIDAIEGYALALDLTARNVQDEAKKKGLPWSIAKGFDTFCPLTPLIPKSQIPDPHNAHLKLLVNGEVRQSDSTNLMLFRIPRILSAVSSVMTLEAGDIILTGTPKGVGSIVPGDNIRGELSVDGKVVPDGVLDFPVEEKPGPYEYHET